MERKITPLVVLGASAGGLEAFEFFFLSTTASSGFAYIVLAHLIPNHIMMLPELLQSKTGMKIVPIKSGIKINSNSVYVFPPNKIESLQNKLIKTYNIKYINDIFYHIDVISECFYRKSIVYNTWIPNKAYLPVRQAGSDKLFSLCRSFNIIYRDKYFFI